MDPQMQSQPPSPLPDAAQSMPPASASGRKKLFMIIAGIVLLIVAVLVVMAMKGSSDKNTGNTQNDSSVYYDRPGFDREKLGDGIGDPAALVFKKTAAPINYQGTNVVQACSVFGPDDLRQTGLTWRPNSLTVAFERNYFDGQSNAAIRTTGALDGGGKESNRCNYTLESGDKGETLWIQVFQPPYSTVEALEYDISRKLDDAGTIGGLKAYKKVETTIDTATTILLRSGDSAVQIVTRISDSATVNAVAERVAANFTRLLNAPDGPPSIEVSSPLMPEGAANACALLSANEIKTVFGKEASPLVTEAVATAIGVIKFTSEGKRYNFAVHDCERRPVLSQGDISSFNAPSLKLEATTYRDEEGAKIDMEFHKATDKQVTQVNTEVGDEVFYSSTTGSNEALTVRKGRYVLQFSNGDKQLSASQRIQQLSSVAQTVISRLK